MTDVFVSEGGKGEKMGIVRLNLRAELEKRRMSEVLFAKKSGVSHTWLRRVLEGADPGDWAKAQFRHTLETCDVCGHKMDVPDDEFLYAVEGGSDRG